MTDFMNFAVFEVFYKTVDQNEILFDGKIISVCYFIKDTDVYLS